MKTSFIAPLALVALVALPVSATVYSGNGSFDFGGPIGTAGLTLTDDSTTVSGTITRNNGSFADVLVFYIDTGVGGFTTTSGFTDSGDDLRRAISGFDGGANRSTLTFASGFDADYAIALGPDGENFGGLWQLSSGGSHTFVSSVSLSPTGTQTAGSYSFSFLIANIGLTAGQSFDFLGTYVSNSGYRSLEALGGNLTGTQGWNPFSQTALDTYMTTPVPEPTALSLIALGAAGLCLHRRRR